MRKDNGFMIGKSITNFTALGGSPRSCIVFRTVGAQRSKPDLLPSTSQGAIPSPCHFVFVFQFSMGSVTCGMSESVRIFADGCNESRERYHYTTRAKKADNRPFVQSLLPLPSCPNPLFDFCGSVFPYVFLVQYRLSTYETVKNG